MRAGRFGCVASGVVLALVGVPSAGATPVDGDRLVSALQVLHGWDADRAAAYLRADPVALRALYLPGSSAADADVRTLRRYAARGVRIGWLASQVFAARVLHRSRTSVEVRVVDRVVGAVAAPGRCLRLPVEPPRTRVVALRWDGARWRVASVSRR